MASLSGKKVVFSGTFDGYTRRTAEERAMKAGCFVTKAVSKKTDILICGEEAGSKLTKAEDLGVEVLGQAEWEEVLKAAATSASSDTEPDTDTETEDSPAPAPATKRDKTKLKRNRTHVVSEDEDDDITPTKPGLVKRRSLRLSDKVDGASLSPPAAKKAKKEPAAAPAPEPTGAARPKCRYWDKCYQKNPAHKKQFRHPPKPGTSAAAAADDDADEEEDMEVGVQPLHVMADGDTAEVEGGLHGASKFTLTRLGDHYTCTCTGWKMQRTAVDMRTCRHLRAYLGTEFENDRIKFDPEEKPEPSRAQKHKNVAVLLAQKYTEAVDPTGWWLSEKLDGVRAFWDGKTFYSRLGNEFMAPKWFLKGLPSDMTLDGELFCGRAKFQTTVSIVKTAESSRWKDVKYCVFDAPSLAKETFEKRVREINELFDNNDIPYAYALEHVKCRGRDHINTELKRIEALGGEGVMIREPKSKYVGSRSHSLLKLKSFHDAEAVVIGHEKGKGRNAAVCGALVCRMACGTEFRVGSGLSDKERRNPPKKGSIITYRFQELSNSGNPRFPTYVGIRLDLDEPCDAIIPPKATDG